jgi:hypothetical protein
MLIIQILFLQESLILGKVVRVRNRQTAAQMKEDRKQKLKDLAKKDQVIYLKKESMSESLI